MLDKIINWAEVWGLLIPLAVIIYSKPRGRQSRILVWYTIIALVLNSIATVMAEFYFSMPLWLRNNNVLYNFHSVLRVLLFSWYIISVRSYKYKTVMLVFLLAYLLFAVADLAFIGSLFFINSELFAAESIILLLLSINFFFRSMQDESEVNWLKHPAFLVCTGICLYEATSFFIFLFFYPLVEKNWEFGYLTLSIHNVMYVILCIMIALALYKTRQKRAT